MNKTISFYLNVCLLISVGLVFSACSEDEPNPTPVSPKVIISDASFVGARDATLNGTLFELGDEPVLDHGFIYSLNEITSISSGTKVALGTPIKKGPITATIENLAKNTKYFVKAYVSTSETTILSTQNSFTTYNTNQWIKVSGTGILVDPSVVQLRRGGNNVEAYGKAYLVPIVGTTSGVGVVPLYEYDPAMGTLIRMPDFPGNYRVSPIQFAIDNKVYVGMGQEPSGNHDIPADFYSFDPTTKEWKSVKDFGGTPMAAAPAIVIGNSAYVGFGSGHIGYEKSFWQYTASTNEWTEKTYPLTTGWELNRVLMAVSINGKGYFLFDRLESAEVWEYNPTTDEWIQKADFTGTLKGVNSGSSDPFLSISVAGKGYLSDGEGNIWQYSPATDEWAAIPDAPNKSTFRFGVNINNKLLVGNQDVYMYIPE